ncbi:mitochondrial inner membrane protein [Phaffia rhodozyma]|uniref:Mitochondrial inner membrane protein n=1 Tax=Phaffia rhodozyma TaxID=264483 RepID=A0A0F7SFI1_PHARH|nr:mitochondrial inner membrane protein [Phaffia rhodozyma]
MTQDSVPVPSALESITTLSAKLFAPDESELAKWKRLFESYASIEKEGVKYLDQESFISAIEPSDNDSGKIRREQYGVLFRVADSSKRGLVSFDDFVVFESLLKQPDADYKIAFTYFDTDGNGSITFDEFKAVFSENIGPDAIPFNFDSDWVRLYIGKANVLGCKSINQVTCITLYLLSYVLTRRLSPDRRTDNEFTQLMKGLQGERLRQAFRYFDKGGDGHISPEEFKRIIIEVARHKLSDSVLDRLPTLCLLSPGQKISYAEVVAFHNVLRDMTLIEKIIRNAVSKSKDGRINVDDFLDTAAAESRYTMFSPLEANLVWHFASRGRGPQTRLVLDDFRALLDEKWVPPTAIEESTLLKENAAASTKSALSQLAEKVYAFIQGGIGGGAGAFVVYPIDMVKTRLQNQRSTVVGEVLYKNWLDCVQKIFRNEGGVRGFYKGLLPQMIGVAPEKAIKLTVNDIVRRRFTDPETGRISVWAEVLAGGSAGGCQVIVTNPLEITKIRLQMQGEMLKETGAASRGAMHVIRQLGLVGLYKGAGACALRDVPFSMIYFTSYAHLKKDVFGEGKNGKQLTNFETLLAAGIGGMPAAYLTTPADVVKTRLQSEAKAGHTHYRGLIDAFVTIQKEEGAKALFKGGVARMIRSSPQFAVTLAVYEWLKKSFPYPYAEKPYGAASIPSPIRGGSSLSHGFLTSRMDDLTRIRARNALKILLDCHEDFGRTVYQPKGGKSVFAGLPVGKSV